MGSDTLQPDYPSQFYEQIEQNLAQFMGNDVIVKSYDEYGAMTIENLTLLIEFRYGRSGVRGNNGRYCHGYHIRVHCLYPRPVERSFLTVLDRTSEIERFVDRNRWGIHIDQIDEPEFLRTEPSILQYQSGNVIGRAVSWRQNLYLGNSLLDPEEDRAGIRLAVNPEHPDEGEEYQPLEVFNASGD